MKGMILAGGKGTRLYPLTRVINKHLLPVGCFPMVYQPILKLKEAGITDLLLTTNEEDLKDFQTLLGTGETLGVNLTYKAQKRAGGIADAVYLAKDFAEEDEMVVLLGDNIFQDSLAPYVESFRSQKNGAKVLLKRVPDPKRYGIAVLNGKNKVIDSIVEKPENPPSHYCVTGIYMYDPHVFHFIEGIKPSTRGEMEITDVNNLYIRHRKLSYDILHGWWIDAGTHEALYQANRLVREERTLTKHG